MANRPCSFIKAGGERCRGIATSGAEYCYAHDPARADERSRNASKAGRAGGNGRPGGDVLAQLRQEIRGVIVGVLKGTILTGTGSVLFQGFNVLLRAVEVERKIREQDEVIERIEALEAQDSEARRAAWRA